MTKIIGLKELQLNTKKIRKEVENGISFIVIYRSKPIFEIRPLQNNLEFADDLKSTNLYTEEFLKRMQKAEKNIKEGKLKTHTTEEFLKSL